VPGADGADVLELDDGVRPELLGVPDAVGAVAAVLEGAGLLEDEPDAAGLLADGVGVLLWSAPTPSPPSVVVASQALMSPRLAVRATARTARRGRVAMEVAPLRRRVLLVSPPTSERPRGLGGIR
jgi:hypothetical protein